LHRHQRFGQAVSARIRLGRIRPLSWAHAVGIDQPPYSGRTPLPTGPPSPQPRDDAGAERRATAAFKDDVAQGFIEVHPLEDRHALDARDLLKFGSPPSRSGRSTRFISRSPQRLGEAAATADETSAAAATALREWFGRAERSGRRPVSRVVSMLGVFGRCREPPNRNLDLIGDLIDSP
jgi:hypothetical protein